MRALALASILFGLALCPAGSQPARTPVTLEPPTDPAGLSWFYREWEDEIDDKWNVLVTTKVVTPGPSQNAEIGLQCVEGLGQKLRINVPGWVFRDGEPTRLQARIDRGPAFDVVAIGETPPSTMAFVEIPTGGRQLVQALTSARERIVLRHLSSATVVIPMTGQRPLVARAMERCEDLRLGR
jgi:hypothetical protein